jgi:hypothetical protein
MVFLRQPEDISRQLEMLQSGEMRSGSMTWGDLREDTSAADIVRLSEAKRSLEQALAILTRQPPSNGGPSNQVHWYTLKRMTPRYKPNEKDDWSLPGETSPEAAIAYFVKDARFSHRLQLCSSEDLSAEFLLEKRNVIRTQSGASQRLQPGDLIETLLVKRA